MDLAEANSSPEEEEFLNNRVPGKELKNHNKSLKMIQGSQIELERELENFGSKFENISLIPRRYTPRIGRTLEGTTTIGIMESIQARKSSCTIEITNRLHVPLDHPKYFSYGACRSPMPVQIPAHTVEAFGFSDTPGDCTRGVCSYHIEGTNVRIAAMYSITFGSFALGLVSEDTPIDYTFYYNARKNDDWDEKSDKRRGLAHNGAITVRHDNLVATATMTDSVKALVKIELSYAD
ncbi:unnamed protein product [Allacma fusca]|uniref:Uncharacterized protein n=1 Tax=Allacma fusca TaxID=39272 RepID=A0A8J2LXA4_9HEXA|nr:unnamed protein product [Allacma fusca]